jgi:hypothetical protein
MKRYMVIETFRPGCMPEVYERFRMQGRMLPDGLVYIDSWLSEQGDRCFQLMEADSEHLFKQWFGRWDDLVEFEVVALGIKPGDEK